MTPISAGLLEARRFYVGDCETDVLKWLEQGAPAGILQHSVSCGVVPDSHEDERALAGLELCLQGNTLSAVTRQSRQTMMFGMK